MEIVGEVYILLFMLRWLHTNPSKIGLDRKSYNPRHQQADLGQNNFFILSFPNVPTHPIISQNWIFVTSHFFTLNKVISLDTISCWNLVYLTGKGDVISCDYSTVKSLYIPQANASLRVQTQGEIHSVAWSDLIAVLKAYSSFREDFLTHLELAYNLGTEAEVRSIYHIIACSSLFFLFTFRCTVPIIWTPGTGQLYFG